VSILYPTSNDKITPGTPLKILISNPLNIPVNIFYRLDNSDWNLLVENYSLTEYDWTVPQSKSSNIYFKVVYYNFDKPQLYWWEDGAHLAEIRSGLFTQSGKFIVTSAADKYIRLWDFENRKLVREVNLASYGSIIYSSPYNDSIATVAIDTLLVIVNFSNINPVERVINIGSSIRGLDCTTLNGGMIAVTSSDGNVYILNRNGDLIKKFKSSFSNVIYSVRFSRDGKLICFAGYEGYIECYEIDSEKLVMGIKAHGAEGQNTVIWSVDISPDNNIILSGGVDRTARVWSTATAKELTLYDSHNGHIRSVRCSPDGKLMLSASLDGTFRQYNASDLNEFTSVVVDHGSPILSADYSPDSKYIVSSGRGNDFKVWRNFVVGEVLDSVQSSLIRNFAMYIPDLNVNLNENFKIPVLSDYNKSEVIFDKDEYVMNLSIEVPILILDIAGFAPKAFQSLDTLVLPVKFIPANDTITVLDALSLLGPDNYGEIRIIGVEADENLEINTRDGSVTISGDCVGDYERNISVTGIAPSMKISPNPAKDLVNISLDVIEDDNYMITISDLNSKVISSFNPGYLKSGNHNLNINTTDLISGIYNLTVSGKRFIFTSILVVNK
jgi:WD40 repeat protein